MPLQERICRLLHVESGIQAALRVEHPQFGGKRRRDQRVRLDHPVAAEDRLLAPCRFVDTAVDKDIGALVIEPLQSDRRCRFVTHE